MKRAWAGFKPRISLGSVFRWSRILGAFPLEHTGGRFVLFKSGIVSLAVMATSLILNIFVHITVSSPRIFASQLTEILNLVQQIAFDASVVCSVWSLIKNRSVLSEIMETLTQLEYAMFRIGIETKGGHSHKWGLCTLCTTWAVFALDCSSLAYYSVGGVFYIFSHYHVVSLIILINGQLSWMASQIGTSFRGLSSALPVSGDLHQLLRWHQRLVASCRLLSSVYSFELLIFFATSLLSCTAEAFLVYRSIKTGIAIQTIIYLFWAGILYNVCFRIISACVYASDKAKEFDASLYRLIVYDKSRDFSFYGPGHRLYFHFCGRSGVTFDAFGFFQIDWQLATTMIAAGCTYVVILVQFVGN